MLLSILTPSIPRRAAKLASLAQRIKPWLGSDIEWLTITDDRPSGPKRNEMMDAARGKYICHLDDDDHFEAAFPSVVIPALQLDVDLVMYDAIASLNGSPFFLVSIGIDHPNEQPRHMGEGRLSGIRRRPWHWCSWRTELARKARFPEKHHGAEDAVWLEQMYPLVKTWHKIERPLFVHVYDSRESAFDGPNAPR